jgi:hypothetical protein
VWRHDFEILVVLPSVAVLVLDAHVGEADPFICHGQAVLTDPLGDLALTALWPAVAAGCPAIPLVQEPLVVALQLVVEDDAADAPSGIADPRLGAKIGAVDPRIV